MNRCSRSRPRSSRITSYNVCYTKLLRILSVFICLAVVLFSTGVRTADDRELEVGLALVVEDDVAVRLPPGRGLVALDRLV